MILANTSWWSAPMAAYEIVFKNKKAQKGWQQICQRDLTGAQECWDWWKSVSSSSTPGHIPELK